MTTSSARPEALVRYAHATGASAARLESEANRLAAILAHFAARCTEYRVPETESLPARLRTAARAEAELAAMAGDVAQAFRAADTASGLAAPPSPRVRAAHAIVANNLHKLSLLPATRDLLTLAETSPIFQDLAWNIIADGIDNNLAVAELIITESGSAWPLYAPQLVALLVPSLLALSLAAGVTIVASDLSRWLYEPVDRLDDIASLFHESFWQLMYRPLDEERLLSLTARIDTLNRALCGALGTCSKPRPPEHAEPLRDPRRGTRDVPLEAMFDRATVRHQGSDGRLYLAPQALLYGEHSVISYYADEQVRLVRVGEHEYAIGIAGLDPDNAGGPNNFNSVARTSKGHTEENEYFSYVKAQFLGQLERLPAGSTLHMAGHSMGGGMIMLVLNDPEVQRRLRSGAYTVASVTTYGAVRPDTRRANGVPPDEPEALTAPLYADTIVNHYVDSDDALALNVGAGHDPGRFANVHILDDGQISDPKAAHSSYGDPVYSGLPPHAQVLPFTVDPAYHEVFAPITLVPPLPPDDPPPPIAG